MTLVKVYLKGWRRMIYVRETRSGGALLLQPSAALRTVRLSKTAYADAHPEPVEFNERWVRSHLREWAKAARQAKRQFAAGAVRDVLRAV